MSWQSERAGRLEIERDHRREFRLPWFALVAIGAAGAMVAVRFLYLALLA